MYIISIFLFLLPTHKINFNKTNLDRYDPVVILCGIAEHECYDASLEERHLVMEAVWNRVIDNFNNNGSTLAKQLLAPKQFTGLFKYNPKQFYFDPCNSRHQENYRMAEAIINCNQRLSDRCIYYWACKTDGKHYEFVKRNKIKSNTQQIFR